MKNQTRKFWRAFCALGAFSHLLGPAATAAITVSKYSAANTCTVASYEFGYTGTVKFFRVFISDPTGSSSPGATYPVKASGVSSAISARYMIESGTLYKYTGKDQSRVWSWQALSKVELTASKSLVKWTGVPLQANTGLDVKPGISTAQILFQTQSTAGLVENATAFTQDFTAGAECSSTTNVSFTENQTSFLQNPERGLYRAMDLLDTSLFSNCTYAKARGFTVMYTKAILPQTSSLSGNDLDKVATGFSNIRSCGAKAIVRFYYLKNDTVCPKLSNGDCIDPPRSTILNHLAQLKPLLMQNEDIIMTIQAGLVGPWGEWHGSSLANDQDRSIILDALLEAAPPKLTVQVRTPAKRHAIFSNSSNVNADNAIGASAASTQPFDESPESRTGHHDDCFLGTLTDYGTFSTYGSLKYFAEQSYVAQNTRFTPMGGETCDLHSSYTPTEAQIRTRAIDELSRMHWSYLNSAYSSMVMKILGARGLDYNNSAFHIQSADHTGVWPEVLRRLGYRLIVPNASFSSQVVRGSSLKINAQVKNLGFAAIFNKRPIYLVLHNLTQTYKIKLNADPRRWEPGQNATIAENVSIPSTAAPGTYSISLWMPDESSTLQSRPEYAVRFAHADTLWDGIRGYNLLKADAVRITQ